MSLYAIAKPDSPLAQIWDDRRVPITSVCLFERPGFNEFYLFLDPHRCNDDQLALVAEQVKLRYGSAFSSEEIKQDITDNALPVRSKNFEEIEQVAPEFVAYPPYAMGLGHWRYDKTEVISSAITTYVYHVAMPSEFPKPGQTQIKIIASYLKYWIDCPNWENPCETATIDRLRSTVGSLSTIDGIDQWVQDCLTLGIDPL